MIIDPLHILKAENPESDPGLMGNNEEEIMVFQSQKGGKGIGV
jgi:hypothetical protein